MHQREGLETCLTGALTELEQFLKGVYYLTRVLRSRRP